MFVNECERRRKLKGRNIRFLTQGAKIKGTYIFEADENCNKPNPKRKKNEKPGTNVCIFYLYVFFICTALFHLQLQIIFPRTCPKRSKFRFEFEEAWKLVPSFLWHVFIRSLVHSFIFVKVALHDIKTFYPANINLISTNF